MKKIMFLLVSILFLSGCSKNNVLNNKVNSNNLEIEKKDNIETQEILQKQLEETSGYGLYDITIEKNPSNNSLDHFGDILFNIKINNIKTTPFITSVGIESCILEDSSKEQYYASVGFGTVFKKALLSGEYIIDNINANFYNLARSVILKKGGTQCTKDNVKMDDWTNDVKKCIYNNSGECICYSMGPMKVYSCIFRISTSGRPASTRDTGGVLPLNVIFKK